MPTSTHSDNTPITQIERLLAHFGEADACWFSSTRPDGRPHLAPIWHVVYAGSIYVVTRRTTVRAANIRINAAVTLALADTSNALIVEGVAHPAAAMRDALRPLFLAKYNWDIATDAEYDDVIQVAPRKVIAWGSHGEGCWRVGIS